MSDALTDFIIKPYAPFTAGVALFGAVWGFFKGVESVLTDDTKLEMAVWLVGQKPLGPKMEPWPSTFAKLFDQVFGVKYLSWKCFLRSLLVSSSVSLMAAVAFMYTIVRYNRGRSGVEGIDFDWSYQWWIRDLIIFVPIAIFGNAIPDYISLLKTRYLLNALRHTERSQPLLPLLDILLTIIMSFLSLLFLGLLDPDTLGRILSLVYSWMPPSQTPYMITIPTFAFDHPLSNMRQLLTGAWGIVFFYPALWTAAWTVLYAGSGFLLKFARRFDLGFDWFNRKFDIEKKPLSAIGLVAGSLVAMLYWSWALFRHFVPAI